MIIGGGPAGMEAARVAALRGHHVHLYEKGSKLGGQLLLAELPRYKKNISDLTSYLSRQLEKLGVEVHLSTEATVGLVAEEAPDAVVLALGAHPFIPDIPGIGSTNVVLAADVLTGDAKTSDRVVIIGGELVGCEVADLLAAAGKKVTVTTLESDLLSFGVVADTRRSLLYRLSSLGVTVITGVQYKEITPHSIVLTDKNGKESDIEADSVVIAAGNRPNEPAKSLRERVAEVYPVGDCVEPRRILEAMDEGYRAGLSL
jgi:NADPH-dependent 2,4-dienoyl-CoA reductase/sulfur reductase-like enzyme